MSASSGWRGTLRRSHGERARGKRGAAAPRGILPAGGSGDWALAFSVPRLRTIEAGAAPAWRVGAAEPPAGPRVLLVLEQRGTAGVMLDAAPARTGHACHGEISGNSSMAQESGSPGGLATATARARARADVERPTRGRHEV